jgi:hypothetical protein
MRPLAFLALPAAALCLTAAPAPAPARAIDETGLTLRLRALMSTQTLYDHTQGTEGGAGIDLLFHRTGFTIGVNVDVAGSSTEVDVYGGALFGGELALSEHLRLGMLGELGAHHLDDAGWNWGWNGATRRIDGATLPYGGGRLSLDLLLGGAVAFDLGAEAIARVDLGRTDTALRSSLGQVTIYRIGGAMLGAGAHLGIRF